MDKVEHRYEWANVFMSVSELREILKVPAGFTLKSIGQKETAERSHRIQIVFEKGVKP